MKTCCRCKAAKPLDDFHTASKEKDGRNYCCKACRKAHEQSRPINPVCVDVKTCHTCKALKPFDSFPKSSRNKDGLNYQCKSCRSAARKKVYDPLRQRDSILRYLYGMGLKEWNEMFESQGRQCKICATKISKGNGWQTDHDHATGKVRGILCVPCNALLGSAQDSIETLKEAIKYLQQHE